jgi:CBS domain-containing protein
LVVDEGRAVGVFTERDLTRGILGEAEFMSRRVGDAMSSPVLSTSSDVDISEAFDLMNAQNVRRLAVVDEDKLVGIVTERDLLRWVSAVTAE